jgi:hypothetical protein
MPIVTKKISEFTTNSPTSADYLLGNQSGETHTFRISAIAEIAKNVTIDNIGTSADTRNNLVSKLSGDFIRVPDPSPAEDIPGQVLTYQNGGKWGVGMIKDQFNYIFPSGPVDRLGKQQGNYVAFGVWIGKNRKVYGYGCQHYHTLDATNNNNSIENPAVMRFWDTDNGDYLYTHPTVTVTDVQFGRFQVCALLSDGTVWINGYNGIYNGFGVASDPGKYTYGFKKVLFADGASIKAISMNSSNDGNGPECYAAISTTNELYTWGGNAFGQCGVNGTTTVYQPTKIVKTGISGNVSKVSMAGGNNGTGINCLVITNDGNVWVAGYNGYGQLGTGDKVTKNTGFIQARTNSTTFLTNARDIGFVPWAARAQRYVILNDGTLWGAGDNSWGQLGDGTTTDSFYFKRIGTITGVVKMVASGAGPGYGIVCTALTNIGQVYTWGYNAHGAIGNGNTTNQTTPYLAETSGATDIFCHCGFNSGHVTGYLKNKHLYSSGYRAFTEPDGGDVQSTHYPAHIDNVKDVLFMSGGGEPYGSNQSTLVLTEDGNLYGWGVSQWNSLGSTNQNFYCPLKLT